MPSNGHAANEPMSINSRTHLVKKPFVTLDSDGADFDFTGLDVRGLVPGELGDVARLSLPNNFEQVNYLPGIRLQPRTVFTDYTMSVIDFSISADATAGPITITLPMALKSGQFYHVTKIDNSVNPVFVVTHTGDLINGQDTITLGVQYADVGMIDAALGRWGRFGAGIGPPIDFSDVAYQSVENNFTEVTTFSGVRFNSITVTEDYELTPQDFTVLVDASGGPVTIKLPLTADCPKQLYHIKQIDDSGEYVTIQRQGSDLIDGSTSINFLGTQYSSVLLQASAPGYWNNIGVPNVLLLPDPAPATPTNLNQVIALLQSYGLCA